MRGTILVPFSVWIVLMRAFISLGEGDLFYKLNGKWISPSADLIYSRYETCEFQWKDCVSGIYNTTPIAEFYVSLILCFYACFTIPCRCYKTTFIAYTLNMVFFCIVSCVYSLYSMPRLVYMTSYTNQMIKLRGTAMLVAHVLAVIHTLGYAGFILHQLVTQCRLERLQERQLAILVQQIAEQERVSRQQERHIAILVQRVADQQPSHSQ